MALDNSDEDFPVARNETDKAVGNEDETVVDYDKWLLFLEKKSVLSKDPGVARIYTTLAQLWKLKGAFTYQERPH